MNNVDIGILKNYMMNVQYIISVIIKVLHIIPNYNIKQRILHMHLAYCKYILLYIYYYIIISYIVNTTFKYYMFYIHPVLGSTHHRRDV